MKSKKYCLSCGKELTGSSKKYCSNKCLGDYQYKEYIKEWKLGLRDGRKGATDISSHIKRYLHEKYNSLCQICGWGKSNPYTGLIPLHVHHTDGDCLNNKEENLQLLCPNCHSLTENFGSLNKNSNRFHREKLTLE